MTPQELKNSILQLAIQGKLVEQRPEEGTAEDLYKKLIEIKEFGIRKGLWGKSKSLNSISENEILFDIPDTWRWIKLGEISSVVTKGTTPRGGNVAYLKNGIGFLRAENVAGLDRLDKTNMKYIDKETHFGFLRRSVLQANDILITIAGTLGRTAIVREDDLPLNANQAVSIVRLVDSQEINLLYLIYVLNSSVIQRYLTGQKKITAIPNLTLEIIENCIIPMPPLAEQKRIVAKIEELLPLIDRYEQAWTRLEDLNKRFPGELQKSILQLAIQGKLTDQRPEEGTGEELYQQIQVEKQALIKAGKIKKEKPLPEITEDEIPFEIPESWKWVRVESIWSILNGDRGKNYPAKSTLSHNGIPFISALNLDGKTVVRDDNLLCLSDSQYEKLGNGKLIQGDIVVCIRGSLGKHGRYPFVKGAIASSLVIMRSYVDMPMLDDYLMLYLDSPVFFGEIKRYDNGTAQPNLAAKSLEQFLFPLPPLAEQKRIVTWLEELLPLCDGIK